MKRPVETQQTEMRCFKCDNVQTIFRPKDRLRPKGHNKKLWCYKCGKRTIHIEGGKV